MIKQKGYNNRKYSEKKRTQKISRKNSLQTNRTNQTYRTSRTGLIGQIGPTGPIARAGFGVNNLRGLFVGIIGLRFSKLHNF